MSDAPTLCHLDWPDIEDHAARLVRLLAPQAPWKGVVAVTRGGLAPALLVARGLDIRVIDTIGLSSYGGDGGRQRGDLQMIKAPERAEADAGRGWLVVDDLVDSGATAALVRRLLPEAHIAVLIAKPDGRRGADTFAAEVPQSTWIVFPWERDEA